LQHCPTGIAGLDEVMSGGLPRGRTTLVAGGPGCGKTLLATQFLVRGAEMGEAGVFLTFEETAEELTTNVVSLGWDLGRLCAEGKLLVDHVKVEREQIDQTGDYDLSALFIRLDHAIGDPSFSAPSVWPDRRPRRRSVWWRPSSPPRQSGSPSSTWTFATCGSTTPTRR